VKPGETDTAMTWICEGCGDVSYGVSPPDLCRLCEHEFFENLADMVTEAASADQH
jgi:rubrerythrin